MHPAVAPEAHGHAAAPVRAFEFAVVVLRLQHRPLDLFAADRAVGDAVHLPPALALHVLKAELDGVHAELAGKLVYHRLDRERRLRRPRRAVGRDLRLVHHHVVAVHGEVLHRVRRDPVHDARPNRRPRIGAGLVGEPQIGGSDRPILFGPNSRLDVRPRRGPGPLKDLPAAHGELHRMPRLPRRDRRDGVEVTGDLPAETAAHLQRHNLDLRLRDPQDRRHRHPDAERTLRGGPDRDVPVGRPRRRRAVRLDVTLVHRRRAEVPLHDYVRLRERLLPVAAFEKQPRRDIAVLSRVLAASKPRRQRVRRHVLVDEGRAGRHRLVDRHQWVEDFVLHVDTVERLLRDVRAYGDDGDHCVPLVQDLLAGEVVLRHHPRVHQHLRQVDRRAADNGVVGVRDDGTYPVERLGLARVN